MSKKKIGFTLVAFVLVLSTIFIVSSRFRSYTLTDIVGEGEYTVLSIITQKPVRGSENFSMESTNLDMTTFGVTSRTELENLLFSAQYTISRESNFFDSEGQIIFYLNNQVKQVDHLLLLTRSGLFGLSDATKTFKIDTNSLQKIMTVVDEAYVNQSQR